MLVFGHYSCGKPIEVIPEVSDGDDRLQLQAQKGNEETQLRRSEIRKEGHREKDELKMEEGEVGSPPSNSHSEAFPPHKKVSITKFFEK